MRVTFWGCRGSIATAGEAFRRFGGHTTCLEIEHDGERIIIDGGTGVRALGDRLAREAAVFGRGVNATFLFTHLHWDHVQGMPFFAPLFAPSAEIDLYGPPDDDGEASLEDVLRAQMTPPTFPVGLDQTASTKRFHRLDSGRTLTHGPFTIQCRALQHPQGSLGYRIEAGGRSLCFATDLEHPDDGSLDEALLDLARGVDVLIHDAQYTEAEYRGATGPSRRGWGHSTYVEATRVAKAVGAERLLLTHHDPAHGDDTVLAIEREAQRLFRRAKAAREARPLRV